MKAILLKCRTGNQTLDAVIGPLNVAAEYVDRISKGNIPEKITDNYNGDFNEIKNNLNQCIDAINLLINETVMLGSAAVEGKLKTRAEADKHSGDFKKIIEGVNGTLDTLVGLLDVMPTPAMVIDKNFQIQYINHIGASVGNKSQNQLEGTKCYDHLKQMIAKPKIVHVAVQCDRVATRIEKPLPALAIHYSKFNIRQFRFEIKMVSLLVLLK